LSGRSVSRSATQSLRASEILGKDISFRSFYTGQNADPHVVIKTEDWEATMSSYFQDDRGCIYSSDPGPDIRSTIDAFKGDFATFEGDLALAKLAMA
jgi:hypothetical protein